MSASASAAITAFQVVFLGENLVAFRRQVIVFAFDEFIFVIFVHIANLRKMIPIVARYLVPKRYRGFAVFPFVIVREKADRDDAIMMNHERIHLRQQLEMLILPFFVWYVAEYMIRLTIFCNRHKAYRSISFEKEAYQNEKDLDYLKKRPFWRFLWFL